MTIIEQIEETPIEIQKLRRDIREAAKGLTVPEAKFLVGYYYRIQSHRLRSEGMVRSLRTDEIPCRVLDYMQDQTSTLESMLASVLGVFADSQPVGRWAMAQCGIGKVLGAGSVAYIVPLADPGLTVSSLWTYCGLAPGQRRTRGQKAGYSPGHKVFAWKCASSFKMNNHRPACYYGALYRGRKEHERRQNEQGLYADQAAAALRAKNFGEDTKAKAAYQAGRLPDGHLDSRAIRWTAKLWLSHLYDVACRVTHGRWPVKPYAFNLEGHHDVIEPQHLDAAGLSIGEWREARRFAG